MNPKQTHDIEQSIASFRSFAGGAFAYFKELTDNGLTRAEALTLTSTFMAAWIGGLARRPKDE